MSQSFWLHGQAGETSTFEMFVRTLPEARNYLVFAGLEWVIDYLRELRFAEADLDFLASLGIYQQGFLDYLADLRFTGELRALPEGTIVPAQAPMLTVTAPRAEAAIIEPAILALVNHQTMIASKVSRIVHAAAGRPVWDFSMRRLHGLGPAVGVARAAYLAGATGSATVAAGRDLGIPTTGTMAHHYIQSFGPDHEVDAFVQFLRDYPDNGVLLVDTYDTLRGVQRACDAAEITGITPKAIRLDSGDLDQLSADARQILDLNGLGETRILASNDLDEYSIAELVAADAPIDSYGVGTKLGTSSDAAYLGGVYKLSEQETDDQRPDKVMKLAKNKLTDPGKHQLWRQNGIYTLGMVDEDLDGEGLLQTVVSDGEIVAELPSLDQIKALHRKELELLADEHKVLEHAPIALNRSDRLNAMRLQLSGIAD